MTKSLERAATVIARVRAQSPQIVALGKVVSLAARAEPELLRGARLELLRGPTDAGLEADLWFSPLAGANDSPALVLVPAVAELLRHELAEDQDLLDRAWAVTRRIHADAPPALLLEEEITYWGLSRRADAPAQVEKLLRSVEAALLSGPRLGLARWAVRALPRLPARARDTRKAQELQIGARLLERAGVAAASGTSALSLLNAVLPPDFPTVPIGVRLLEKTLELSEPPVETEQTIHVPQTEPLWLEVAWQHGSQQRATQVNLPRGQRQRVGVGSGALTLRTADGRTHRLRPAIADDLALIYDRHDEAWVAELAARLEHEEQGERRLRITFTPLERLPSEPQGVLKELTAQSSKLFQDSLRL